MNYAVNVSRWEDDEYVISINGRPIGPTVHHKDAHKIAGWLAKSLDEIQLAITPPKSPPSPCPE